MKGLAIINPSSGKQVLQRNALEALHLILEAGIVEEIHLFYTQKKDDATHRAAAIQEGEYGFVMAVGGDGTVNEVVNGLIESHTMTPLVIIGAGTTNDFATAMGLPKRPADICEMVKNMYTAKADVGKINDKYFLNVAAGGLLSEVAHKVTSDLKTSFGKLAYYIAGMKDLSSLKLDTVPLQFELDNGETFSEDVFLFVIANTRSVGGFSRIAPKAMINDGKFDLCIIKKVEPLDVIPLALKIQAGNHLNSPLIGYYQSSSIRITPLDQEAETFPVDYDGENGGTVPIEVTTYKEAINLVVPTENQRLVIQAAESKESEENEEFDEFLY